MKSLLAITLPVSLFMVQAWFSFVMELNEVQHYYFIFLLFYFIASGASFAIPVCRRDLNRLTPAFDWFAKSFIILKIILTGYFFLIFLNYILGNGYYNIRQYMTSDEVQGSPFYFAPFMYIDAYIAYPLNYIVLIALYLRKNKKMFCVLSSCIVLHLVVFYASRTIFYNALILVLLGVVYSKQPIVKLLGTVLASSIVVLAMSSFLLFNRDEYIQYGGLESLVDTLILAVGNYHIIPPLFLEEISGRSEYFNSNIGYGLATFGFLVDPLISLFASGDAKSLMASKILSAEAQSFKISIDSMGYNAFTTFLYPAVFDFGRVAGPAIYGSFFGFAITSAFRRRDAAGFLAFIILGYFVYFNSFTFFITGDWFWVFVFIAIFFGRPRQPRRPSSAVPVPS